MPLRLTTTKPHDIHPPHVRPGSLVLSPMNNLYLVTGVSEAGISVFITYSLTSLQSGRYHRRQGAFSAFPSDWTLLVY